MHEGNVHVSAIMSIDELRAAVEADSVDTVVLAMPDMLGRLQGKRLDARHFLDDVVKAGAEACSYLLTVDVDMGIVEGFDISGWSNGLGDFTLAPDLTTLRRIPWMPGSSIVLADATWADGAPVVQSPRQILQRQIARLAEHGWGAQVATELEFLLFEDTYRGAHEKNYHGLRAGSHFDNDYSVQGTSAAEPLMRQLRRGMRDAGLNVEAIKGECNLGQFELGFKYADPLTTCDNHAIYKTGAKEIAAQNDVSITFMSKFDQREGNSCHVHLSLVDESGDAVFPDADGTHGFSRTFEHFLAGQLAASKELSVLLAPNVNSYKRFQPGSFAPTALRWGRDNRTCALRVVGHGPSLRFENRAPGGDVNPYLAVAAIIAAGLHGVDNQLELEAEVQGNAYEQGGEHLPANLRAAADLWARSAVAVEAFGQDVVDHYANAAYNEVTAFDAAVTDWERLRGFERM
jgi:glutamine synthetase